MEPFSIGDPAMTGYTKLTVPINPGGGAELRNLAKRCGTTEKILGELAVRQLMVAARAQALPVLLPLDPGVTGGVTVWLNERDRAALDALAEGQDTTPESLASLAVRHMLAQARKGALPMLPPLKPMPEPVDPFAGSEDRRADCNFEKARLTIDKLVMLSDLGADPAKPRAHIDFMATLDEMQNFKPA